MTNTISTTVTNGIVLNSGNYGSQLSITTSGDVAPTTEGATGVFAFVVNDSIYNAGRISGGAGDYHHYAAGGNGGTGVVLQGFGIGLTNQGTILGGQGGDSEGFGGSPSGNGGAGVSLAGGTVTNDGRIDGGAGGLGLIAGAGGAGIYFNGGTVINAGTIAGGAGGDGDQHDGAAGDAVQFGALAGTLIIDPGAVFIGNVVADSNAADVLVLASAATAGTISLLGDQFTGFSTLIEDAGANWIFTGSNTLEGTILLAGSSTLEGTVVLEGTISGDGNVTVTGQLINDETIRLDTGLTLTGMLSNRGAISGENGSNGESGGVAIYMNAGLLINGGTISGGDGSDGSDVARRAGNGGAGVHLAGGTLTNQQTVDGGEGGEGGDGGAGGAGVAISGGSLTNSGTINGGAGGYGSYGYSYGRAGGAGIAISGGSLTNSGTINGGAGGEGEVSGAGGAGVAMSGGVLTNEQTINGGAGGHANYAASDGAGGAGIAISGGSLTNSGTINGGAGGPSKYTDGAGGVGVAMSGGALTNNKMIDGGAGGATKNTGGTGGAGGAGVYLNGGTLTNAGTIAGGAGGSGFDSGAAGDAVQFGALAGTLIIDPGAAFIGNVVADARAADVLVLASAATAGTISLLGDQFTGFSTLIEDAGANWIFTGSNTLEGTVLLAGDVANEGTITGDGSLTVTGQLINDETIRLDTGLTLTGMLSNRGAISGENGSNGEDPGGGGVAIYMNAGLLINGGTIGGGYGGDNDGLAGRAGNGGAGVHLAGGTLTNQQTIDGGEGGGAGGYGGAGGAGIAISGGSLTNSGTINGGAGGYGSYGYSYGGAGGAGVAISGGSLTNSGTINGGADGLGGVGGAGGVGLLLTAGAVTNNMTINGGAAVARPLAGYGGAGVAMSGGSLTNNKMIDGAAGGAATASEGIVGPGGAGGAGVYFNGGTLTNAGTIAGGAGGTGSHAGPAGDAVQFGAASGTLIIDPRAVFIGNVVADSSAEDVLVLASTNAVAGTLSGLGSQFTGFSVLDFTPNARWTVEGSAAAFASLQSINNFAHGDTIVLDGFADNPADTTYVTGVGLELTDTSGNQITLDIVEPAGATTANFSVTDPEAETTITYTACFAAGTRILCADGRLARVEDLCEGDDVELFDGTAAPIIWIGVRTLDLRRHPRPADVQPILIARGALGNGLPWNDLVVSPDHGMYLQDHLIPAKALLNGFTVRQLNRPRVTYYHLELPHHAVIFAEGAPAETYLESGNRGAFENGGPAVILHPDFANSRRQAGSCAPLVEDGHVVEAVRAGILRCAAIATTDDPALSIDYDNGAAIIASRAAVPGEIFADPRDRRRLGVKVARLTIGGKTVRLDHPELAEGWHDIEPDGRWTNGHAIVPPGLIPPGTQIAIELAAAMRYPIMPNPAIASKAACSASQSPRR